MYNLHVRTFVCDLINLQKVKLYCVRIVFFLIRYLGYSHYVCDVVEEQDAEVLHYEFKY